MKLSIYLNLQRGRAKSLAHDLQVSESLIAQWARGKPVAAERCPAIESATEGAVSRRDLRPDDWAQIWPELAVAHAEQAPANV